jgi:anti-sigma-K factor RskA
MNTIPDDVAALISAHALGALEPDQAELAERHIAASDDCRRAYEDALETAAALAMAVADSEPPAELRGRIVAAARAERRRVEPAPRRKFRLTGLLTPSTGFAVIGVAAAIVFALIAVSQHSSASNARDDQQALVAILAAPDAHVVPLKAAAGGASGGRMIVSQNRAALVSSLRNPPPGRVYQAWGLRPGGASPVPLPTFSGDGDVVILDDVGSYDGVGVTVEPSGGSQKPSSAPFAVATL